MLILLPLCLALASVPRPQTAATAAAPAAAPTSAAPAPSPVEVLRLEAERADALVSTPFVHRFLAATSALPSVAERVVYYERSTRDALTPEQFARKTPEEQKRYEERRLGEEFYYLTRYGSPLAYARVLDLVCAELGPDGLSGKRLLDFGYGGIGHLKLLSGLGCEAVGVDVDALLSAYYRPEDQGPSLRLVHGAWPAEAAARDAVGGGYDVVLSKNTLKKGYIRPSQEVDPRMLVQLGVTPEAYLGAVAAALKPGGLFAIYNICPGQKEKYIPWAEGTSPFTRAELSAAGFEVLAFDAVDDGPVRELAFALKWDEQGMDVEGDTFAWYTLAQRK